MKKFIRIATFLAVGSLASAYAQMPPAQAMSGAATLGHPEVAPITATHDHGYDGSFSAGAELLYLKPRFGGNPAFLLHTDNGSVDVHAQTDFTHDYNTAPRLWVGYGEPGKVGLRGQYFKFDDRADQLQIRDAIGAGAGTANVVVQTAAPGGLGFFSTGTAALPTVLTFDSGLSLKAADIEATYASDHGRMHTLFSGGLRYAELDQTYFATEVTTAGLLTSLVDSRKSFDGVGPTVAAESRVGIGDGGLAIYGNGRASLVFGNMDQAVRAGVIPTGARGVFTNSFSSDDALPIGELELGLEWRKETTGRSWFLQGGVAAQTWFGAGNAGNVEDLAPRAGVGGGTVNRQGEVDQADSNANLSLIGFKIAGGIKF